MKGYVIVSQWHSMIKHVDDLMTRSRHTGDARSIDTLCGWTPPKILLKDPGPCSIGECVMRVEDDGSLALVRANYDSSG